VTIAGRGGQRAVAQPVLDGEERDAVLHQMRGKGMAQGMDAVGLANPGATTGLVIDMQGSAGVHGFELVATKEEPRAGAVCPPVIAKHVEGRMGEDCVAILVALALLDANHHTVGGAFDMVWPQATDLANAQAGAIKPWPIVPDA